MSTAAEASAMLASLEAGRQTGCLTVHSVDGRVGRVYVLMGKAFHAEGPAWEGEPALADALSWPDVILSFDEKAHLPDKQTITSDSGFTDSSQAASTGRLSILSGNRRLIIATFTYLGAGCLFVLVMVVGIGVAILGGASHFRDDSVTGAFVVLL